MTKYWTSLAALLIVGSALVVLDHRSDAQTPLIAFGSRMPRTVTISSLTRSGSTATAVTASPHRYVTNDSITVSGATQTQYNITAAVTVTDAYTFTYTVSGTPATPATGSPVCVGDGKPVPIAVDGSGNFSVIIQ